MLYEISDHPPASCFTLSTDDRIAALKLELERLRGGNGAGSRSREVFDGVELTARNRYKAKVAPPTIPGSESRNAEQGPEALAKTRLEDSTPSQVPVAESVPKPSPTTEKRALHPFAGARDANYLPPRD